ncbi:MAG: pyrroline-5-carboxylate reductase [Oscillospiraceae bacterium]|nr:pyrroline-5-carboxylate reductase [Oscillospiraceae bacterium]
MDKIGFIGVGNMGGTLARIAVDACGGQNVYVSSRTVEKARQFAEETGCTALRTGSLAERTVMIFLGVKPQMMEELFAQIAPILAQRADRFVLVTMAAGLTCERIAQMAGGDYPVIRIMPNTPALVGQGVIPYCGNDKVTQNDFDALEQVLAGAGLVTPLSESMIDAASAVSGCGPAFVYIFIEALTDAAVSCGLPRSTALEFAAQTVLGAGKMVLETGQHPGALKDAVCSPAGSTIAGVKALESGGFRAVAQNAVIASFQRAKELGK